MILNTVTTPVPAPSDTTSDSRSGIEVTMMNKSSLFQWSWETESEGGDQKRGEMLKSALQAVLALAQMTRRIENSG